MLLTTIEILLRGMGVGLASSMTIGPVAVLCIQRTLSKSRHSGLVSGMGVVCADTLMALVALLFYSMLQTQIEQYSQLLRVVGGVSVVIVGVVIFFQNPIPQIRRNRIGKTSLGQDFVSMFGFTIANFVVVIPYILAFFAMFSVGTVGENNDMASIVTSALIIAGFLLGAVVWWFLLTSLISLFRREFRPRHLLMINRIAGIIIGLLGIYTIFSAFYTVMPNGVIH